MFNPKSIAIIGASATPGKAGYNVVLNLKNSKFPGRVLPINPTRDEVLGFPSFDSIKDISGTGLPGAVDLAILCLPPRHVRESIIECMGAGVGAIIVESGQLSETPEQESLVKNELLERANATRTRPRIMGPNSIGVVDLHSRVNTSLIPFTRLPEPERQGVAIVGQTGLIASGYLQRIFADQLFPVSKVCCLGNKADVNEADILEFLSRDDRTRVIVLYLEDVKDGPAFTRATRACTLNHKPVIVIKSGATEAGARAVSSHTGSLAGNDRIFTAALVASGAMRVPNFEDAWLQAQLLYRGSLPASPRLAVVSISGAGCALSVDAASQTRLEIDPLPPAVKASMATLYPSWFSFDNPVDLWAAIERNGSPGTWQAAFESLLGASYDALLVVTLSMPESLLDWRGLAGLRKKHPGKPVVLALLGGHGDLERAWEAEARNASVPVFRSPDAAIQSLNRAWLYARWLMQHGRVLMK